MNSREKGKRGERWWRDVLRAHGYMARRGQQFCGSPDSPDVICEALSWIHFEVKFVERLNIEDAMDQVRRDSGSEQAPILVHKKNHRDGLITMGPETFFRLLRGDFPQPRMLTDKHGSEKPIEPTEANSLPPLLTSPPKAERNQQKQFRSHPEGVPTAEQQNQ